MIGAPNSLNLNCKVRVMKEAPGPSVSEEIADIFTNYDIDEIWLYESDPNAPSICSNLVANNGNTAYWVGGIEFATIICIKLPSSVLVVWQTAGNTNWDPFY